MKQTFKYLIAPFVFLLGGLYYFMRRSENLQSELNQTKSVGVTRTKEIDDAAKTADDLESRFRDLWRVWDRARTSGKRSDVPGGDQQLQQGAGGSEGAGPSE